MNYDNLTDEQEIKTKKLINFLDIGWEDAYLAPRSNKRSIRTAYQLRARRKVYKVVLVFGGNPSLTWMEYLMNCMNCSETLTTEQIVGYIENYLKFEFFKILQIYMANNKNIKPPNISPQK